MIKKSCYSCGKKSENLYEGLCEVCYKEKNPPIEEIKPINLQICNMCGKIHYGNALYELDEIKDRLPQIVKKNIVINKKYSLENIKIKNFEIKGHKITFDVVAKSNFK
jgi:NMD protein affecting ribosome stability and mRNA decay